MVHDTVSAASNNIGAAIGMTEDYRERAIELAKGGANILCIDVAHGHHTMMKDCLGRLRKTFGEDVHLMAGNVATLEAFNDLADFTFWKGTIFDNFDYLSSNILLPGIFLKIVTTCFSSSSSLITIFILCPPST